MWNLPGPGLEPMSPALAGGYLTSVPPGKSCAVILNDAAGEYLMTWGKVSRYFI